MTGHATAIDLGGLAQGVRDRLSTAGGRLIVAIAGAPGSGKSTVAEELAALLNAGAPGTAAVLPMDGFHYDDLYLVPAGMRPRKGAPDTFDVGGFRHLLQRLRARDEPFVAVPVFDRSLEIARAGARLIPAEVPVIVTEGNYLLLGQGMWPDLRAMFDMTVLVDVPESVLRARLAARWAHYGLTAEETRQKLEENDLPNGRLIVQASATPDFVLPNG